MFRVVTKSVHFQEEEDLNLDKQMRVAEHIKYLRNVFGYTQTEIADALHICRSTYAHFEAGKKILGADTLLDLANFYHVRIDTILQPDSDKFVNDVIFSDRCKNQALLLADAFYQLSPDNRDDLLQRAKRLQAEEESDVIPTFDPILI